MENAQGSVYTEALALNKIVWLRDKKCIHYFDVEVH